MSWQVSITPQDLVLRFPLNILIFAQLDLSALSKGGRSSDISVIVLIIPPPSRGL